MDKIIDKLTWQDIREIVEVADSVLERYDKKQLLAMEPEGYYGIVLDTLEMQVKARQDEKCDERNVI